MNSFLRPILLFLALLLLFALPEPGSLRGAVLNGLIVAVAILVALHLVFVDRNGTDSHPVLGYSIIVIAGAVLTALFWFRAGSGSFGIETGLALKIARTLFFWVPAALFAVLYRSAGEGWRPASRGTTLARLGVSVLAGLLGLAAHEIARNQIEPVALDQALSHVERQLPEGDGRVDFRRERSVLYLDVVLDASFVEAPVHSLRRLHAIADQAARLVRRSDVDRLDLRIRRNDMELAALVWPDPVFDRPIDALVINYGETGLDPLPQVGDLDLLFDAVQSAFRPISLEALLDGETLVLRGAGEPAVPDDPSEIAGLVHDWRAAGHVAVAAARLFEGLESIRLEMPGHSVSAAADRVRPGFGFQRLLPVPAVSVRIQIHDDEVMPELPEAAHDAPVTIIRGDGEFDTRRKRSGPLWPWETTTLSGYEFHITGLDDDGTVHFVVHRQGLPEEARWMSLRPGQTRLLDSLYLRNVKSGSGE